MSVLATVNPPDRLDDDAARACPGIACSTELIVTPRARAHPGGGKGRGARGTAWCAGSGASATMAG